MLAVTFYDVLKFLHVALAVAWVGGALMLTILAELAIRSPIPGRAAEFAREVALIGQRFFAPVSLAVLGLGFWLVSRGHWGYPAWVVASLAGFGASFVIGSGFLGPQSGKLSQLIASAGPDAPAVKQRIRLIVNVARIDLVVLFVVVFFMVAKVGE